MGETQGGNLISILIPVFNEEGVLEKNCADLHAYLNQHGLSHEIVITSNGSTDATVEIGNLLAAKHSWFRFYSLPEKSVGAAFANGVKQARGEILITQDADLSSDLGFILHASDLLRHCDMVVGSKSFGRQRRSPMRILGSSFYVFIAQFWLNLPITDYSMGAKGFKKSAVISAVDHLDRWTGFILELSLYLQMRGKTIVQIGVDCQDTRKSRFNLLHEGVYRYMHLFRCWKMLKNPSSWLNKS